MKANIISLGCAKNLVDTEKLLKQFDSLGYSVDWDNENSDADVVVVNTCGFIGDAKEESVNTILEQAERKKDGEIDQLYVIGCLPQRYADDLRVMIPEVDGYFGKFDWCGVIEKIGEKYNEKIQHERILTTPSHYAYLKISEGCNRKCSYCAIPVMTGKHTSTPIEDLIEEATKLVKNGVKELLVVAQDLTFYGIDLYGKNRLAELINKLADIPGLEWLRLHYAYPAGFPIEILDVMRERDNICKYLDIALQHSSDHMLRLMRRGITQAKTRALINTMREKVPGIFIRTTLITGHPGETQDDFDDLCKFVTDMRFERLGVFPYSHEDETYCYDNYEDDVPDDIKQERADKIMALQSVIAEETSASFIGKKVTVLVDREEDGYYMGRTEFDSPEVDPEVLIDTEYELELGGFYDVKIVSTDGYDLIGELVS